MADRLQPGDWPMRRPEARPGEVIDRSGLIEFTFDGVKHRAHPGDTVGSALAAAGVKTLSRSFKYHRPRGLLCCAGNCPNCLVQIGGEANVRACRRPVEAGMEVRSQNAWPSLDRDLMSLAGLGAPLMPVGFYYKTFIRPARLWPLYERVLRRAAGLGSVDEDAVPGEGDKQYLHADVAVVGAGPAGIAAAAAAAREGARVLLFDENPEAGGHLRCRPGGLAAAGDAVQTALAEIERSGNAVLHLDTAVVGWYQDNWLAAFRGNRLLKVRARAIVAAAGAVESPGLFPGNDLPGILLAGAARRLLHLHGVLPGRRTVVEAGDDEGWRLAAELSEAGVEITALVDDREAVANEFEPALRAAGAAVHLGSRIAGARGGGSVKAALVGPAAEAAGAGLAGDTAGAGEVEAAAAGSSEAARPAAGGGARGAAGLAEAADTPAGGTARAATGAGASLEVPCDSIVVRGRFAPANELLFMAGARGPFDDAAGEFRLGELPAGLFNAGRCRGVEGAEAQAADGAAAGRAAAAFAGAADAGASTRASSPRWQGSVSPYGTPT
ncbi:MAG: 2Fe-2S iron-sulfur cluster-binding protein, partial [Gemmatimonadetes bacterium]|nr:2Fe-2S iron-sulfur cluster-binding protein [Gemmatimonadota bacterium]